MRKMATVRRIDEIRPIEGADAIECAVIGGWTVVVKYGEYAPGDLVVYCEIDSWIPTEIAPFLTHKDKFPREYEGIKGERLRTIKLRGQLSQGLVLPFDNQLALKLGAQPGDLMSFYEGTDVSELLGIVKYDPPVSAQLAGEVRGNFPSFIPKTDQERIQNLKKNLHSWLEENDYWEVTEKLDGSSMTVYMNDGVMGVCSRNLDLRRNEDNTFWKTAIKYNLEEILLADGRNLAIQGELIGEGIQGNPYKIKGHEFHIFDIYVIDEKRYMFPLERFKTFNAWNFKYNNLHHVPLVGFELLRRNIEEFLIAADAKSILQNQFDREGLVFKHLDGTESFKVISNKFLLKQKS